MASILVVDDDPHIAYVLAIWLRRNGHHVVTASNGAEATDIVRGGAVELVISDMNMPIVDGLEFVRCIRNELCLTIPIVMLTARCDLDKLREELSSLGVDVFGKPFLPSQLVAEIDRKLGCATELEG